MAPPFPADIPDCNVCFELWQHLNDDGSSYASGLEKWSHDCENCIVIAESFNDALSSTCSTHKAVLRMFRDYTVSRYERHSRELDDSAGPILLLGSELRHHGSLGTTICGLHLVNRIDISGHGGTARLLDPDWVDISLLKQWKNECDADHGPECLNPMKIPKVEPAWLVDVQDGCLVRGETHTSFVALSYTWGTQSTHLVVDAAMQARLRVSHSLEDENIMARLPPTILDAMYLTSALGERYLWVDALCIASASGHTEETSRELDRMGAIYASAVVTIVAADGTSSDGIGGLKNARTEKPRKLKQVVVPFGSTEQIVKQNYSRNGLNFIKPYSNRGWTFQEFVLSPRKIIFGRGEAHWQCHREIIHETAARGLKEKSLDDFMYEQTSNIMAGFPALRMMNRILMKYNEYRNFKYDEDALPGVLGLFTALSRPFGGFVYGIPINMFDGCLNWTPANSSCSLTRRKQSNRPLEAKLHPSGLPSWSWIGWKGLTVLGTRHSAGPRDPGGDFIEEWAPVTSWWAGDTPSGARGTSQLFKINSSWHETAAEYKDFSKPLPPGWTRKEVSPATKQEERPYLCPDGCDKYVFVHEESYRHPYLTWFFPFPISAVDSGPPIVIPQLRYLFCTTNRAFVNPIRRLLGHETYDPGFSKGRVTNLVALASLDSRDRIIGALHLHDEQQAAAFDDHYDRPAAANAAVELVAINKTRRYSKIRRGRVNQDDIKVQTSDRCGVLWIEWQDGIAYRRASGWVYQDDWEQLEPQEIDLILG